MQRLTGVHTGLQVFETFLGGQTAPKGFWERKANQLSFFDWLGDQLGYKSMDDRYNVTQEDIYRRGGSSMLSKYFNSSPSQALQILYPKHDWKLWEFKKAPQGLWKQLQSDTSQRKRMFEWLEGQLGIKSLDQWYRVSVEQVQKLASFGGQLTLALLAELLQANYSQHQWEKEKLLRSGGAPSRASQRTVLIALQEIFPSFGKIYVINRTCNASNFSDIYEEYKYSNTNTLTQMELDIFLPQLSLAIEYQGEQHFRNVFVLVDQKSVLERDLRKREACVKVTIFPFNLQ